MPRFFDSHPEAGALGVKMVDGSWAVFKGIKTMLFLRHFTSLLNLFGLCSGYFRGQQFLPNIILGIWSADENQEVDVLAGAFMMARKEVMDKISGFDETLFYVWRGCRSELSHPENGIQKLLPG